MESMHNFSIKNRKEEVERCQQSHYDLLVIGGGITGAGIALDAVSRGLTVALIEKNDFASGTSSKSTKLIHGGLRYLKQLEFGLVKETGRERAILHKLAPHLVIPEKMLLPIVRNGSFTKWSASMAVRVYDFLANVKSDDKMKTLDRSKTLKQEPLLSKNGLKSGIIYTEYQTNDARLTFEIIKTAHNLGVQALNYCECKHFLYEDDMAVGVQCEDKISGQNFDIRAKLIVSATGPWVDDLRKKDEVTAPIKLQLSKGIHIVVSKKKLPINQAVYFDDFKGRMLFAVPKKKVVYIGTTDTPFNEDKDKIEANNQDIQYVLNSVNNFFNIEKLGIADILSSWGGAQTSDSKTG